MLILNKFIFAILASSFCSFAFSLSCDELRTGKSNGQALQNYSFILEQEIANDNLCAKNALGVALVKGDGFPQDGERAYAIFYSLAERNYPPSQLNLGIMLSRQQDDFNPAVLDYLLGVFARYYGSKEWGSVAVDARDLARNYIDKNKNTSSYRQQFEDAVRNITYNTASNVLKEESEIKERYANIAGMVALGFAVSRLASANLFRNNTRYYSQSIPFRSPRVYSVHPMGGNYLWIVPH